MIGVGSILSESRSGDAFQAGAPGVEERKEGADKPCCLAFLCPETTWAG